nr:MAG TPA: portal protein [Caudoviricetes sp.]
MFVKRLVNWVTSWGGPLGTASGQQIPLPVEPILDQTKNVTPDAALQISAVFACVELLAQTISTLPLYVYKEMGNGGRTPDKGRLWMLLHERPNAWMTPSEFLSAMVVNRMLRGNAYAQIIRDSEGDPIALVPLSPDQMEVSVTAGGEVYTYYQDGVISVIAPANIIHWKGLGNGYIGLSKLEYMRATADEAISAQDNASRLYGAYSKPSGVLQTDSALNDEQLSAVFERFKGMSRGGAGLYVVDRGLKYQQLSLTPADAQLLQTRQFSVEEICRWFGVPGVLVGSTATTTWGSGIQQIVEGFHKFTIGPLCKQLEQALSRRLVDVTDMDTTIEFKLDGFLRTTPEARASFYSTMAQNGAMTRNEIRRLENLPPVKGGDALTAQSNLVPIEKLGMQERSGSSPKDGTPVRQ